MLSVTGKIILVKAARDPEAEVWYVESSDVPGLNLEADTLEGLLERLPGAILDLMETGDAGEGFGDSFDVPIELVAHASARVHRTAA